MEQAMKNMRSKGRAAAPIRRDAANRISLALPRSVARTALGARLRLLAARARPWTRLKRRLAAWLAGHPRPRLDAHGARAPAR